VLKGAVESGANSLEKPLFLPPLDRQNSVYASVAHCTAEA